MSLHTPMENGNDPIYWNGSDKKLLSSDLLERIADFSQKNRVEPFGRLPGDPLAKNALLQAVENIYELLGAHRDDRLYLTSSYSHTLLEIYQGICLERALLEGKDLLLAPIDLRISEKTMLRKMHRMGLETLFIGLDQEGKLDLSAIEQIEHGRAIMLSMRYAHPSNGVIQNVFEIGELCRRKGILFHLDVTDVIGKLFFSCDSLPVDIISFDGALLGGSVFPSAILVRKECCFDPLLYDVKNPLLSSSLGGSSEHLYAMGLLCADILDAMDETILKLGHLQTLLEQKMRKKEIQMPYYGVERLCSHLLFTLPKIHAEYAQDRFAAKNFHLSSGRPDEKKLSDLMLLWGRKSEEALCSHLIVLDKQTTLPLMDKAIAMVAEYV